MITPNMQTFCCRRVSHTKATSDSTVAGSKANFCKVIAVAKHRTLSSSGSRKNMHSAPSTSKANHPSATSAMAALNNHNEVFFIASLRKKTVGGHYVVTW